MDLHLGPAGAGDGIVGGIGLAIAEAFSGGRRERDRERTIAGAGGRGHQGDPEQAPARAGGRRRGGPRDGGRARARCSRHVPAVDVLGNNMGMFEPKPFFEIPDADWMRFFEVNVLSGVRCARAYMPGMLARDWGRIIFISSESGLQIPAEMIQYGTTKTAQLAVARGLAEMTRGTKVTVNTVLPGPTKSEGVGNFVEQLAAQQGKSTAEMEREFFQTRAADLPAPALRDAGGGRRDGGLRGQRASLRRERRRAARRRRRGARHRLSGSRSSGSRAGSMLRARPLVRRASPR